MAKRGRPSVYTPEIAEEICRRLAEGEALSVICQTDGMPGEASVRRWVVQDYQGFSAKYAQAREAQAHKWADEILAIADDGRNDMTTTEDGREIVNAEVVQRSRLRVDARKWLLSKILPKQFGEKMDVNVTTDTASFLESMRARRNVRDDSAGE